MNPKREQLEKLIEEQSSLLEKETSSAVRVSILYNLIFLNEEINSRTTHYENIKKILNEYILVIKNGRYGYDTINSEKIIQVLRFLAYQERIGILKYAKSTLIRELPEYDINWIIKEINQNRIRTILSQGVMYKYPKALLLYSGLNLKTLSYSILTCFITLWVILLPSPYEELTFFEVEYLELSDRFVTNHTLNVLLYFINYSEGISVLPLNIYGVVMILVGKVAFVLLIVNFVYRKISDYLKL